VPALGPARSTFDPPSTFRAERHGAGWSTDREPRPARRNLPTTIITSSASSSEQSSTGPGYDVFTRSVLTQPERCTGCWPAGLAANTVGRDLARMPRGGLRPDGLRGLRIRAARSCHRVRRQRSPIPLAFLRRNDRAKELKMSDNFARLTEADRFPGLLGNVSSRSAESRAGPCELFDNREAPRLTHIRVPAAIQYTRNESPI